MVLTEGFAAGTPVVASDIAGYRDVVARRRRRPARPARRRHRAGRDAARPRAGSRAHARARRRRRGERRALRLAEGRRRGRRRLRGRAAVPAAGGRAGARRGPDRPAPADGGPRRPARSGCRRSSPLPRASAHRRADRAPRRLAVAALAALAGAYLALQHIGLDRIGHSLVTSSPTWVLVGLALMCVSMLFRAVSWHAILKAALPDMRPRLADAWQGTAVGVLMSATLPARLGEPSRALIVARRLGRPREALPVVVGTLVSQTLLNVLALVILGVVMFSTVGLFAGKEQALIWYAAAPVVVARARARRARARALRAAVALRARGALDAPGARRRDARAPRPDRLPPPAPGQRGRDDAARRLGRCSWSAATCSWSPSGSTPGAPTSARPRRSCSRSTSRRCSRSRRRTSASSRPRACSCSTAPTGRLRRRARLRDHPAGRRGRDRGHPRRAGAGQGGHVLARGPAAGAAHLAGRAAGAAARGGGAGAGLSFLPRSCTAGSANVKSSIEGERGWERRSPGSDCRCDRIIGALPTIARAAEGDCRIERLYGTQSDNGVRGSAAPTRAPPQCCS